MEKLVSGRLPSPSFWKGRRVLLTGHTGFKGSWLLLWLSEMGAEVHGYALAPPTDPSLYATVAGDSLCTSTIADIRDADALRRAVSLAKPEVVIHMAAQPLVRESYRVPADTYAVNLMGTVNLLDAIRQVPGVRAVVNITTDKVYENREWAWGYRETDRLGGFDPYSNSKACSEMATASFRSAFFPPASHSSHGVSIATARAGNVIGGGDWALDRIVPDIVRSLSAGEPVPVRNPHAIRPWQHVLDPLCGYLLLAERLFTDGPTFGEAWNFGPDDASAIPVGDLVSRFCAAWGEDARSTVQPGDHPHEASFLKLDSSKSRTRLDWHPQIDIARAVEWAAGWHHAVRDGASASDECLRQIRSFGERPL